MPDCTISRLFSQVLYFEDFCPRAITIPAVEALSSVDWLKYGLAIKSIQMDHFGHAIIELEGMQTIARFDVVLHKYQKKCFKKRRKVVPESIIVKDAVGIALEELKEKNPDFFLSKRAKKIQTYAPDLSKAISGLILSSNDSAFKEECASILGLLATDLHQQRMESCINNKILDIIKMTDGNPNKINAIKNAEDTSEEPWNKDQEDEDDNEDSPDEPRSIWDYL